MRRILFVSMIFLVFLATATAIGASWDNAPTIKITYKGKLTPILIRVWNQGYPNFSALDLADRNPKFNLEIGATLVIPVRADYSKTPVKSASSPILEQTNPLDAFLDALRNRGVNSKAVAKIATLIKSNSVPVPERKLKEWKIEIDRGLIPSYEDIETEIKMLNRGRGLRKEGLKNQASPKVRRIYYCKQQVKQPFFQGQIIALFYLTKHLNV